MASGQTEATDIDAVKGFEGDGIFKGGFLATVYDENPVESNGKNTVVTRFPPEPNGFLHLGHSKAIAVNFGFARYHKGECYLRFDDTNPSKEEGRFFDAIEEVIAWLGFKPARITHSSDQFGQLYAYAEQLIQDGGAYVCHCTDAEIKASRGLLEVDGQKKQGGARTACAHRERPVEESLAEFRAMQAGKYKPGEAVLRMKQDLTHPNPQMWDLAAYRVPKPEEGGSVEEAGTHHRTGTKWKIYPTYDFAHCLCDSLEGITHSLCTTEFEMSRQSYEWLCHRLKVYTPMQREYGRLSLSGVVLSKRRLTKLVNSGYVHDWDDPRLYTLIALRRRGIPPGAILSFVNDVGVTKSVSFIEIARFEQHVRKYLEVTVPRLNLVLEPLLVEIENLPEDYLEMIELPFSKDPEFGTHEIPFTKYVYIDRSDFREQDSKDYFRLAPGKAVGLLKVPYPIIATSCEKDEIGRVTKVLAQYVQPDEEGKFKKPKSYIQWVPKSEAHGSPVHASVRYMHPIFDRKDPDTHPGGWEGSLMPGSEQWYDGAMIEPGFWEVKKRAPWPAVAGERNIQENEEAAPETVRFQGQRTAYFCEDKASTKERVVLNRIVSLKEDSGKDDSGKKEPAKREPARREPGKKESGKKASGKKDSGKKDSGKKEAEKKEAEKKEAEKKEVEKA